MMQKSLWAASLLSTLWACQPADSRQGNATFTISQVYPSEVLPGTQLFIQGENLPDSLQVYFGDVAADAIQTVVPATTLSVTVPPLTSDKEVEVRVSRNGNSQYSNSLPITVKPFPKHVPTLYWTTSVINQGKVNPQGSVKTKKLYDYQYVRGLEIDTLAQTLYWGTYAGTVYQGSLSGGDSVEIAQLEEELEDIALDKEKNWLYYSTRTTLCRISLKDTSRVETLYEDRAQPKSLQLSADESKLYWCEPQTGSVFMADLSSKTNPVELFDPAKADLGTPVAIALDEAHHKIYIADTPVQGDSRISVGTLPEGGEVEVLLYTRDGIGNNVADLAIDQTHRYLYWISNEAAAGDKLEAGDIMRMALDEKGAGPEVVFQQINFGYMVSL